jgi:hypothetical protein
MVCDNQSADLTLYKKDQITLKIGIPKYYPHTQGMSNKERVAINDWLTVDS